MEKYNLYSVSAAVKYAGWPSVINANLDIMATSEENAAWRVDNLFTCGGDRSGVSVVVLSVTEVEEA